VSLAGFYAICVIVPTFCPFGSPSPACEIAHLADGGRLCTHSNKLVRCALWIPSAAPPNYVGRCRGWVPIRFRRDCNRHCSVKPSLSGGGEIDARAARRNWCEDDGKEHAGAFLCVGPLWH
jgi:hypothetical protein